METSLGAPKLGPVNYVLHCSFFLYFLIGVSNPIVIEL